MATTLRAITKDNWDEVSRLSVADHQRHLVASNAYSIVQAHYEPEHRFAPFGIYDDDTPVGFVMYGFVNYRGSTWWEIVRLMVDQNYQRRGYARAGMQQAVERLKAETNCDAVYVCFALDNADAKALYVNLGFEDTGIGQGEMVYRLKVN